MNIFSSRFKIFLHVFFGLVLGGCIALVYLSSSATFRKYLQHHIEEQFAQDYQCQLRCHVDNIDWLTCSLSLSSVQITPLSLGRNAVDQDLLHQDTDNNNLTKPEAKTGDQDSWSVSVETVRVKGSWLSLLLRGYVKISLVLEHMIMQEQFDQIPEGLPQFCKQMLTMPIVAPVVCDEISVVDGLLYLKRRCDGLNIQIPYVSALRLQHDAARVQLYVHNGSVLHQDAAFQEVSLVHDIDGSIVCDLPFVDTISGLCGQVQLNYQVAQAELVKTGHPVAGFLAGKLEHGVGEFVLKTEDGSVVIDPIKITCSDTACLCNVVVAATSQLLNYFELPEQMADVAGSVGLELSCDLCNLLPTLQASIVLQDITYKNKPIIPGGKIVITDHCKQGFTGVFAMHEQNLFQVKVQVEADKKLMTVYNLLDLHMPWDPTYMILQQGLQLSVQHDASGIVRGSYGIDLYHQPFEQHYQITGRFEIVAGNLRIWGNFNDVAYEGLAQLFPQYLFHSFCAKRGENLLIDINSDPQEPLSVLGAVDFSVVQALVPQFCKMSFAQEGSFTFRGYFKDGVCGATVQTHYAHIRIPYLYNVIQNICATAQFHLHEKKLEIKDVEIELYEGKISCSQACVYFDKNFAWNFVHAPLMLHDVMLSWQKGLYGLVSGRVLLNKLNDGEPLQIQGQLMVQKAEVKENIFSAGFQEMLSGMGQKAGQEDHSLQPYVDISLFTKDPLQITTSFLTAKAVVDVRIQGLLRQTELSGAIRLLSGSLYFPYKPLEIVEGRLLFMPEQPFDPVIELVAKGKLKRFHVSLRAWGSALDPHVQFEAQPYLSEDQIISMLLLGIEDQSLSMMVPAFLAQRLKDIIFGPALSNLKLKSVFDRLLQSLKYVRFIPQFTNKTGRGGVHGIFEIDASEHLQGKIDTNFSKLEDTKFDVDYAVTDDVTLRLQKDGPSTYGGQVEFRWKFS